MANQRGQLLDPTELAKLRSLSMLARVAVEGFLGGLHRSLAHGFGMEFEQYRNYTPGEDLKYLDWKVLARSDRLYTKVFQEETDTDCLLLLDRSGSMGYQGSAAPCTKLRYAAMVAACLAYLVDRQGDHPGLYPYADRLGDIVPPRRQRAGLSTVLNVLEGVEAGGAAHHRHALEPLVPRVRRRSVVVLISDFLEAEEETPGLLRSFAARGCDVLAVQVLDRDEYDLPPVDFARFIDLETEARLSASPKLTRERYRSDFGAFQRSLADGFNANRVPFVSVFSDESLGSVLAPFLRRRAALPA
ncbi:MAG: DUF58 domain-containing protein [Opitutales bacterium]